MQTNPRVNAQKCPRIRNKISRPNQNHIAYRQVHRNAHISEVFILFILPRVSAFSKM